jgi:hypothetical protein
MPKTIPVIGVVVCRNLDNWHDHLGIHVRYLIAVDKYGDWGIWDDPDELFVLRFLTVNKKYPPETVVYTCLECRTRGAK